MHTYQICCTSHMHFDQWSSVCSEEKKKSVWGNWLAARVRGWGVGGCGLRGRVVSWGRQRAETDLLCSCADPLKCFCLLKSSSQPCRNAIILLLLLVLHWRDPLINYTSRYMHNLLRYIIILTTCINYSIVINIEATQKDKTSFWNNTFNYELVI